MVWCGVVGVSNCYGVVPGRGSDGGGTDHHGDRSGGGVGRQPHAEVEELDR
jgi:hypothetical protein